MERAVRWWKRLFALSASGLLVILGVVASGCLGGGGSSILYDEERDVPQQKVATFPVNNVKRGQVLHFEASLVKGTKADFLWMNASDLPKYLDLVNATYDWIEKCSILAETHVLGDCQAEWGGDYFFVVDNTQRPISGANPESDGIRARVKITTK